MAGSEDAREQFNARGQSRMAAAWDWRRSASWAPYLIVPSVAVCSRFVKKQQRVKVYVGTLVCYGLFSVIMYNTDASADWTDDKSPPLLLVQQVKIRQEDDPQPSASS
jgi:cytosine/uracil/thiamine/allantoin permease